MYLSVCLYVCLSVLQITPSLAVLLGDHVLSDDVLGKKSHVKVLAFGGEKCPGCKRIAKWKHPQVCLALHLNGWVALTKCADSHSSLHLECALVIRT